MMMIQAEATQAAAVRYIYIDMSQALLAADASVSQKNTGRSK